MLRESGTEQQTKKIYLAVFALRTLQHLPLLLPVLKIYYIVPLHFFYFFRKKH